MPAGVTPIEMASEGGRATARDRAEDRALLRAQPRMLLDARYHPARGGYRPPPPQAGSCRTRLPLQAAPREDHGR